LIQRLDGFVGSITTIAGAADASTPTVARMVQKLGFRGFSDFQATFHRKTKARISGPISKQDTRAQSPPDEHILNCLAEAAIAHTGQALARTNGGRLIQWSRITVSTAPPPRHRPISQSGVSPGKGTDKVSLLNRAPPNWVRTPDFTHVCRYS